MRHQTLILLWILFFCAQPLGAQVTLIDDLGTFGPQAVALPIEAREGRDATDLFAAWGLRFIGDTGAVPRVRFVFPVQEIVTIPIGLPVIRNESEPTSGGGPLIVEFRHPVRLIGFRLGNGDGSTSAEVRTFSLTGEALGTLVISDIDELIGPPVALEASGPKGIAKLVVDYGDSEREEQISDLIVEFIDRPTFTRYIPHLADGRLESGHTFQTSITILCLSNSTAQGAIQFFDSNGEPLNLDLQAEGSHLILDFSISGYGTQKLTTGASVEPAASGYARIDSNVPFEATATFSALDTDGTLLRQAGIASERSRHSLSLAVEQVFRGGTIGPIGSPLILTTALAMVNVSDREAQVLLRLRSSERSLTQVLRTEQLVLAPREHRARFLEELFDSPDLANFEGGIQVFSSAPLVATVIHAIDGFPASSLPLGSAEAP